MGEGRVAGWEGVVRVGRMNEYEREISAMKSGSTGPFALMMLGWCCLDKGMYHTFLLPSIYKLLE